MLGKRSLTLGYPRFVFDIADPFMEDLMLCPDAFWWEAGLCKKL